MGAIASQAVAMCSALVLIGIGVVVLLCLRALRHGTEFEGEIKVPSMTFRLRVGPRLTGTSEQARECGARKPDCSPSEQAGAHPEGMGEGLRGKTRNPRGAQQATY